MLRKMQRKPDTSRLAVPIGEAKLGGIRHARRTKNMYTTKIVRKSVLEVSKKNIRSLRFQSFYSVTGYYIGRKLPYYNASSFKRSCCRTSH